ncbi:hypothetical protein [Paenibacillus chungangensis]|uniref:CARDB domain-containing protein n=1 Tax=Paenibacillus chungangensis TaxID=696535 RepID=A0ABW3HKS6_9BACL
MKRVLLWASIFIGVMFFESESKAIPVIDYEYGNVLYGEGGWITGLIFHPVDDTMYIRTDVGGTYRLDESSMRWIALNDDLPYSLWTWYSVDGIAVDPGNSNIVYAAVGLASNAQNTYPKGTVLKSLDKGETWSKLPIDLYFSGNGDLRWVGERIVVDPFDSNRILVASRKEGLWLSEDAGLSWSEIVFPGTLQDDYGITALLFDRNQEGVVYAAAYGDGIYWSADSGDNWVKLTGSDNPHHPARMSLSSSGTLHVTTEQHDKGVLKFENGLWTNLTPDANLMNYQGQPAGYNGISVHPANPQLIVVSPHNMGGVLFYSDNGGTAWKRIDIANSELQSDIPWMKPAYWATSIGALEFDPYHANRVWFTDWHGIWMTENITASTVRWEQIQAGHEEMTTRSVRSIPQGTRLAIGGADMGGGINYYADEYPERIDYLGMSEIYDWDYAESNPSHVVMVGGSKSAGSGAFSSDAGTTWTKFPSFPAVGTLSTKVAVSATNPSLFLVTTSNYSVFRTADGGHTWTEIFDLPTTAKGPWTWSHVLKSDRLNGNIFYFIDDKTGDFYRSTNGGLNFTKTATLPLPNDRRWIYIQPSFTDEGELWISLDDKGLFRSTDGGCTFTQAEGVNRAFNIALGKPYVTGADPTVYMYGVIGQTEGLFRSIDNGQSWQDIDSGDTGFGNRPQTMDASRQVFGLVFVGTTGRGVRYGKLAGTDITPPKITLDQIATAVNQPLLQISGQVNEHASVTVNGNSATVDAQLRFNEQVTLQPGINSIVIAAEDSTGNTVTKRIEVTYDTMAPVATVHQANETVRQAEYVVSGAVNEAGIVEVAGTAVPIAADLTFQTKVVLTSGSNSIVIRPVDEAGNEGNAIALTVEYVPIDGFDLIVTEVGVEEAAYREGDDVHLYAIVKNQGNSATPLDYVMVHFVEGYDDAIERTGSSHTRWYPGNGNQSSAALGIAFSNMQLSIAPGESVRFVSNGTYAIPTGGTHFKLLAIADSTSKYLANEEDRTNNTWSSMVSSALITDFFIGTQVGVSVVDSVYKTVDFQMNIHSQSQYVKPTIGIMPGSTVEPASGQYINIDSPTAFTVTTANGIQHTWTATRTVTVNKPQSYFDLEITEVGVDAAQYEPGDAVRFYAIIENKGNIATPLQYLNVHFVVGGSTAAEKGKKWYPDNGALSSTALRSGDANPYLSILPGPENAVKIYSTGTYTILERRQEFSLLGIADASGKFFDVEYNRRNNAMSTWVDGGHQN